MRPSHYQKKRMKQFNGYKYSTLQTEPVEQDIKQPIGIANSHILLHGTSGSGKTYFLKDYLDKRKKYIFCIMS